MKQIITDWNGTLSSDLDATSLNRYIAIRRVIHEEIRGRVSLAMHMLTDGKERVEKTYQEYLDGNSSLRDVYNAFNEEFVNGAPAGFIRSCGRRYGISAARSVDPRIVRPLRRLKNERESTMWILSNTYESMICAAIRKHHSLFDMVLGDDIKTREDGTAIGFGLTVYGKKGCVVMSSTRNKIHPNQKHGSISLKDTYYIGDDPEEDGQVADVIPRGHFIVPFLASDEARDHFKERYGAFIPETEAELLEFLMDS